MFARYGRLLLLAAVLSAGLAGCPGSDDIGRTLPVTGKVTIDTKPLASGDVVYHPDEQKGNKSKMTPSGKVNNGEYTLSSGNVTTTKPGAPPGWYKVTITPTASMMGGDSGPAPTKDSKVDIDSVKQVRPSQGMPIAQKYTNVKETPLAVEVKAGNDAAYNLDAKSK